MGYVSSREIERAREIAKYTVHAAIDRVCGKISKREWDEIKFAGVCYPDPMLSHEAASELLRGKLDDLQYVDARVRDNYIEVTYKKRAEGSPRLDPTDKEGVSIEQTYAPERIEVSGHPLRLTVEWKHPHRIDTSRPFQTELRRLQALVDAGKMSRDDMVDAVSRATATLGIRLTD